MRYFPLSVDDNILLLPEKAFRPVHCVLFASSCFSSIEFHTITKQLLMESKIGIDSPASLLVACEVQGLLWQELGVNYEVGGLYFHFIRHCFRVSTTVLLKLTMCQLTVLSTSYVLHF